MSSAALWVHRDRSQAVDIAKQAVAFLEHLGHTVRTPPEEAELLGLPVVCDEDDVVDTDVALAVAVGGDGTMLRAVRRAVTFDVPVLGINVGQLGYLTEVDPAHWEEALVRFLRGDHEIEPRMLLAVTLHTPSTPELDGRTELVLNEAVVEKVSSTHTIRLGVALDGVDFTSYVADGVIVATPTGSTAYAFSARGPIVDPRHRAVQLTPVSPHMLFDRTLVLDPATTVRLGVEGDRPAALALDGRLGVTLMPGDAIICTAATQPARFVTFGERKFHRILKAKFGLNDR